MLELGVAQFSPDTLELRAGSDVWWMVEARDDSDITTALTNIDVTLTYQ